MCMYKHVSEKAVNLTLVVWHYTDVNRIEYVYEITLFLFHAFISYLKIVSIQIRL